jgi:serine/threonine protein kinase
VILGHDYGPAVDVWSCGVVMFVLYVRCGPPSGASHTTVWRRLAGYLPFDSDDEEEMVYSIIECRPAFDKHPDVWEQITPLGARALHLARERKSLTRGQCQHAICCPR